MMPDRWTELFFLDEATAFAAGHRPCFECRREDALKFKYCWIQGNPDYGFTMKTSIKDMDEVLQRERIDNSGNKVIHTLSSAGLAEGTFVLIDQDPYVLHKGHLCLWTPSGYERDIPVPENKVMTVLTPGSIVNAFRKGYVPQIQSRL